MKDVQSFMKSNPQLFSGLANASLRLDYPQDQLLNAAASTNFARNEQHNPLLAEALWAYRNPNDMFIAEQVSQVIPVNSLTGQWRSLSQNTMFDVPEVAAGKEDKPNKMEYGSSLTSWDLSGKALCIFMSNVDKAQAVAQWGSEAKWRQVNGMVLMHALMLYYEAEVATVFQADASYATGYYSTESPLWSASNSTPYSDAIGYVDTPILAPVDSIIMGHNVYSTLRTNNDVVGRTTVTQSDINMSVPNVGKAAMENLFGYPIMVGSAIYNSAPDTPATPTFSRIWADYFMIGAFQSMLGGPELSPSFCKTFQLQDGAANLGSVNGFTFRSIPSEMEGGVGGEYLVAAHWTDVQPIASKSAYKAKVL